MRKDKRSNDQLRSVSIEPGFQKTADGSALISWGQTRVLCAASVEDSVPPFCEEAEMGWITAEYTMLPGSTRPRKSRRTGGRESEIKRLIGRSLRAAVDLSALGKRTITVDCDVIEADGGTRVASITGGFVALALAMDRLKQQGLLKADPMKHHVAAVSVGIVDREIRLDLPYEEDCRADVDMNVVMAEGDRLIEVQATAERENFVQSELMQLCSLAAQGIRELFVIQSRALGMETAAG